VILEKHADFLRDFRGDTIHPSTLELMHELGLLEEFLKVPHQEARELHAIINGHEVPIVDFTHLPTRCQFIALMPQWDFLNFLAGHAKQFPTFTLQMEHEVVDLLFENERVTGVRVQTPDGVRDFAADLVIGADGRHALTHTRANFELLEFGVPIDVLWMRLPKLASDPDQTLGFFRGGRLLVLIDRADYFQAAMIIPKGGFTGIQARGLPGFQHDIVALAPFLADRITQLDDWSRIRLLTVQINRLRRWCREGLLCIGDSAHAMSPAGGVGINLALQDAVATANLLAEKLRMGPVSLADLEQVQRRREWPTRLIQSVQVFIHRRITVPSQDIGNDESLPFLIRFLKWFPFLRRIPARFIGLGPRPEHIHSPAAF